jgi:GntR family transcriptional repressor for pyruvate dehydrogenase complex
MELGTIERKGSLSERLARMLEEGIATGALEVGAPIPSERMLAEEFRVSRTVVREAVRALVAKGLLDVRTGSGTVVTLPTAPDVAKAMSLVLMTHNDKLPYNKVSEARRIIEVEVAGLAAERRSAEDLVLLQTAVDGLVGDALTREEFVRFDMEFHRDLARATGNELLLILEESIAHVLSRVREAAFDVEGAVQSAHHHHARLLAAVKRGDAQAAQLAMKRHLSASDRILRRVSVV